MSVAFDLYDADNNAVSFDTDEACDTGQTKPFYGVEMSQEKSAGGYIKQQIRPGKRFMKVYEMNISEDKYIDFINLITNNADDYFIEYTTAPTLLSNDTEASLTNNFKVGFDIGAVEATLGTGIVYKFNLTIASVVLL